HTDGTQPAAGPAADASAGAAAAHEHRGLRTEPVDDGDEALVEHLRPGGHPKARDPPRLLDQRHGDAAAGQPGAERVELRRLDAPTGAMRQDQGGPRPGRPALNQPGRAVRRLDHTAVDHYAPASPVRPSSSGIGSHSSGPLLRTLLTRVETG